MQINSLREKDLGCINYQNALLSAIVILGFDKGQIWDVFRAAAQTLIYKIFAAIALFERVCK